MNRLSYMDELVISLLEYQLKQRTNPRVLITASLFLVVFCQTRLFALVSVLSQSLLALVR